jgi:hypothetical protein
MSGHDLGSIEYVFCLGADAERGSIWVPHVSTKLKEFAWCSSQAVLENWLGGWAHSLHQCPKFSGKHPPIIKVLREIPGTAGQFFRSTHEVQVSAAQDPLEMFVTLVHELAHAWSRRPSRSPHGAEWRAAYAELIRYIVGTDRSCRQLVRDARALATGYKSKSDQGTEFNLDILFALTLKRLGINLRIPFLAWDALCP